MLPQESAGKDRVPFLAPDELLFRQVPNSHVEDGEVSIFAIQSKFDTDPKKCISVVRSRYTNSPFDAMHPNCAGGKDLSQTHIIMYVQVGDLPKGLAIKPVPVGRVFRWDTYPHHDPLPLCYAHSTICCCNQDEPDRPVRPPQSVRTQFREWFAENLVSILVMDSLLLNGSS